MLAAGRRAARDWAARLRDSDVLRLHVEPELDIVTMLPALPSMREIDAASEAILEAGMADPDDPVFLSLLSVDAAAFAALHPEVDGNAGTARVLRSVLMKPEHEHAIDWLHARVEALAR
jgi:hypothetical protein